MTQATLTVKCLYRNCWELKTEGNEFCKRHQVEWEEFLAGLKEKGIV